MESTLRRKIGESFGQRMLQFSKVAPWPFPMDTRCYHRSEAQDTNSVPQEITFVFAEHHWDVRKPTLNWLNMPERRFPCSSLWSACFRHSKWKFSLWCTLKPPFDQTQRIWPTDTLEPPDQAVQKLQIDCTDLERFLTGIFFHEPDLSISRWVTKSLQSADLSGGVDQDNLVWSQNRILADSEHLLKSCWSDYIILRLIKNVCVFER